ncbi:MAG: helix-turn-helix transcriptional regulator [Myxococcota bacterium]
MNPSREVSIRVVDAAYDLNRPTCQWLGQLLESGEEVFDQGLGCVGAVVAGRTRSGEPLVSRVIAHGAASQDLSLRFARGLRSLQLPLDAAGNSPWVGRAIALSACRKQEPGLHDRVLRQVGSQDVLALVALDADLHGVVILVPTRERIRISLFAARRWQSVVSHIAAADRLRRGLGLANHERMIPLTALPQELAAEVLAAPAEPSSPTPAPLRDAAVLADRSQRQRAYVGASAPDVMEGMVDGRWSRVDCFDVDGRRLYLARPNGPGMVDPRALTAREREVALRAARGESGKLTSHHMGISPTRVSALLRSAMRKLGAKTSAELVVRVRCLEAPASVSEK